MDHADSAETGAESTPASSTLMHDTSIEEVLLCRPLTSTQSSTSTSTWKLIRKEKSPNGKERILFA